MPEFNRFDICEAHLALEWDWHSGGWLQERPSNQRRCESTDEQLRRMGFRPGAGFRGFESLTENGKEIYRELEQRYQLPVQDEEVTDRRSARAAAQGKEVQTVMLTLKILQDDDPLPPDEFGDDVEQGFYITTTRNRYFERNPELLDDDDPEYWSFPLYMYAHSGVALSLGHEYPFNDRWDSGQVGFVRIHKTRAGLPTEERARASAESYIEAWNQFLSGDVWGYVIEDEEGEHVDSCWGFYGEQYAREEGEAALVNARDYRAEQVRKIEEVWAC